MIRRTMVSNVFQLPQTNDKTDGIREYFYLPGAESDTQWINLATEQAFRNYCSMAIHSVPSRGR